MTNAHAKEMMRRFVMARRDFLRRYAPDCPRCYLEPPPMLGGLRATPITILIEQVTPAQWACKQCRLSWVHEPEPPENA